MGCTVANCTGADYTESILRNILLSGIYDADIRRSILGTAGIVRKPVQEIINLVETKEAARDATGTARPAAAAASTLSYKRDRASAKSSPPPRQQSAAAPSPRKVRCRCGDEFDDYVPRRNGTFNLQPYEQCRNCYLQKRPNKSHKI